MKTFKNLLYYSFLALTMLATSCSADGEDGANGQDGQDGMDGQDGQDGSAGFIFSDWIDIDLGSGGITFEDVAAGEITQEIRDTYGVLMYGNIASNVIPLPYSEGVRNYSYFLREDVNSLRIFCSTTDGSNFNWSNMTRVRYILIPPPNGRSNEIFDPKEVSKYFKSKGLDVSNYTEVRAYFQLRD